MMEPIDSKKKQQFWLGILVSVASLAAIFFFIDPAEIMKALKTARYDYLALSGLGIVVFLFIRAARWRFMLSNEIAYWQVFHIQNIGYMLSNILPFRIGDVARAVLVGNVPPVTVARGLSTMVVERILDMVFIVTLLPFTLAGVESIPDWMRNGARVSGVVAIGAIGVLIVAANKRPFANRITITIFNRIPFLDTQQWVRRVDELLAGLSSLTRLKDGFILIVYSILVWLPIIFAYNMALRAAHIQPTWAMSGFVVSAAAFSVAAPSSPAQIGVFHAGVIAALKVLGQPEVESAGFAFLYHTLNVTLLVVLGVIGLTVTGATFRHVVASVQQFTKRQGDQ